MKKGVFTVSKKFYGILVIVLIVIIVSIFIFTKQDIFVKPDIYGCAVDKDCISVASGCCGCSSGGSNTAINKNYQDYWNARLSNECKEIACPAVISTHGTCSAEPKCVNNRCELVRS